MNAIIALPTSVLSSGLAWLTRCPPVGTVGMQGCPLCGTLVTSVNPPRTLVVAIYGQGDDCFRVGELNVCEHECKYYKQCVHLEPVYGIVSRQRLPWKLEFICAGDHVLFSLIWAVYINSIAIERLCARAVLGPVCDVGVLTR